MKVSAIIPCYNASKTITQSVESLIAQTRIPDEIIIVDDGSDQATKEVLRGLSEKYALINVITQENNGVCKARNTAIEKAEGQYILTLDADDTYNPTFLEKALLMIAQEEKYGGVMCGYNIVKNGKIISSYQPSNPDLAGSLVGNGALSCMLFKKSVLQEIGLYDEQMKLGYEDWDLNIRMLAAGYEIGAIPEFLFNYQDSENSRNDKALENDVLLKNQLYQKYKSLYVEHIDEVIPLLLDRVHNFQESARKIRESESFKIGNTITKQVSKLIRLFK